VKRNFNPACILLTATLAVPLALAVLAAVTRSTGATDSTLALLLLCTVAVYLSCCGAVNAGVDSFGWLFGRSVDRRRIVTLLLLSVLNIAGGYYLD